MSQQRYQVQGKIGQGGLGEVYLAQDTQLDREVALKRMKVPEDGNMDALSADLLREAKTLSALQHPNIVTVYDVGKDDKGPFVVLELLKGETLDAVIDRGGMTLDDFKQVVMQTLEGLIAAQALGLVHRDLKPGNLMVIWLASGKFQLKILDFGLAKFSLKARPQTEDQGGGIFGSIFFMAPEQFERFPLDARTDMYSLGCIYYQILTTKHPFDGETGVEVMASHLQHHVVPLKQLRPDLPDWLCYWVMWLISREMDDRPADARMALEYFMAQRHGVKGITPPPTGTATTQPRAGNNPPRGHSPTRQIVRPQGAAAVGATSQRISGNTAGTMVNARSSTPGMMKVPVKKKSNVVLWSVLGLLMAGLLGGVVYLLVAPAPEETAKTEGIPTTPQQAVQNLNPKPAPETTPAAPVAQNSKVEPEVKPAPAAIVPQTQPPKVTADPDAKFRKVITQLLSGNQASIDEAVAAMPPTGGGASKTDGRLVFLREVLKTADNQERTLLHKVIGSQQILGTSTLLREDLIDADPEIREAALKAVLAWTARSSVFDALLESAAKGDQDEVIRVYSEMILRHGSVADTRFKTLQRIQPLATSSTAKADFLNALASIPYPEARALAVTMKDAPTLQRLDQSIAKLIPLGNGTVPLQSAEAKLIGPENGVRFDATAGYITEWKSEEAAICWDVNVATPGKFQVVLNLASTGADDARYRLTFGTYTRPLVISPTPNPTSFVDAPAVEFTINKPGVFRIVVQAATLPTGKKLMNLRGAKVTRL
jgi:serine/threonine protein kinase